MDRTVAWLHADAWTWMACQEGRSQVCSQICLALAEVRQRTPFPVSMLTLIGRSNRPPYQGPTLALLFLLLPHPSHLPPISITHPSNIPHTPLSASLLYLSPTSHLRPSHHISPTSLPQPSHIPPTSSCIPSTSLQHPSHIPPTSVPHPFHIPSVSLQHRSKMPCTSLPHPSHISAHRRRVLVHQPSQYLANISLVLYHTVSSARACIGDVEKAVGRGIEE